MSEKHKSTLLKANAAIAKGDHEGFLAFCTEDTVWDFVGDEILNGKDAVREWMEDTYIEPPQVEVETLIAEGEYLTAIGTLSMKDEDGNDTRYSYCDVWRFRDDKLAELKAFVIGSDDEDDEEDDE